MSQFSLPFLQQKQFTETLRKYPTPVFLTRVAQRNTYFAKSIIRYFLQTTFIVTTDKSHFCFQTDDYAAPGTDTVIEKGTTVIIPK